MSYRAIAAEALQVPGELVGVYATYEAAIAATRKRKERWVVVDEKRGNRWERVMLTIGEKRR